MNIDYVAFKTKVLQRQRGLPFLKELTHIVKRYEAGLEDIRKRLTATDKTFQHKAPETDWRVGWQITSNCDCAPWFCLELLQGGTLMVLPKDFLPATSFDGSAKKLECTFRDEPTLERTLGDVPPF